MSDSTSAAQPTAASAGPKSGRRFEGQVAVITGGSSGIGTHATQIAHAMGARVAVTARTQDKLDHLREVPAAVRFLSCEPLLGPLDGIDLTGIGWVIAGGESGPRYRPIQLSWARGIRDACTEAEVPFFFKQWGGRTPKANGRLLEGRTWDEMPTSRAALAG